MADAPSRPPTENVGKGEATVAPTSVWAAKAALREKEREAERKKEEEKKKAAALAKPAFTAVQNGGAGKGNASKEQHSEQPRRDAQQGAFVGREGELIVDGSNATMWMRVKQEYAGFIVGPLGKVINEISAQSGAHILSPRKGDDSIFFLSGPKACVNAAATLIRVKEQEGKERESSKGQQHNSQESTTGVCAVPESLIGFVMGAQRSVITAISHQTRTRITCPVRGGKPEFIIVGAAVCVEAAKACIDAKVQQAAMGSYMVTQETTTIHVTIGVEKVGLIVGPQGSVIQGIAITTGTTIISPRKGQDPVFIITGPKRNVEVAKKMIESKAALPGTRPLQNSSGGPGGKGKKGKHMRVDAMNRPLIVDGLSRGAPP